MPWSYWSQNSDATADSQKDSVSIIRIYSPVDLVIRKRPAETSTNAAIVRPVFGDEYTRPITALTTEGRKGIGRLCLCRLLPCSFDLSFAYSSCLPTPPLPRRQAPSWARQPLTFFPVAARSTYHQFLPNSQPRKPESRGHRGFTETWPKA